MDGIMFGQDDRIREGLTGFLVWGKERDGMTE
jgi:hypothetical protein